MKSKEQSCLRLPPPHTHHHTHTHTQGTPRVWLYEILALFCALLIRNIALRPTNARSANY